MRLFLIIDAILLSISCCLAQQEIWYLNKVSSNDGLSETTNEFLHTDRQGYTWIGSLDGINLFDGKTVKTFKPNSNDSLSLKGVNIQSSFFEDKNGDIWFTTEEAINCYKKSEGHFIHDIADGSNIPNEHIAIHLDKEQYLWVHLKDSLYRYNINNPKDSYKAIAESSNAIRSAVLVDTSGKVNTIYNVFWQRKTGFEIIHFDKNYEVKSRKSYFDQPNNDAFPQLEFSNAIKESNGKVWLVSTEKLILFNENSPKDFQTFLIPNNTSKLVSVTPIEDKYFRVLLSSSEILLFDKDSLSFSPEKIQIYDKDTRSKIENLYPMFPDKDSIIWFASKGKGIYFGNIIQKEIKNPFDLFNLKKHRINHIYEEPDGNILCSTNFGKGWKFDENYNFLKEEKVPKYFKQITDVNNQIWNISINGLCKYSNGKNILILNDKNTNYYDLIDYNKDYLILGTNKGIILFNKETKEKVSLISNEWAVKLFKDNADRLWSANMTSTLKVWAAKSIVNGNPSSKESFPNIGLINDIKEDKSRRLIWVAGAKGLLKIDSKTLESTLITESDGLPNQFIYSIILDKDNTLWLSTNDGIIHYNPENLNESFKQLVSRDGLSSDKYLPGAAILSKNGNLWFGSNKGVDVFKPDVFKIVGKKPKLAINSLKIYDKEWTSENTSISKTKKINLSHTQNTLKFELAALEYTDPKRNQFKVYLDNGNKVDSTFLGTENSITYANLSPGNYIFKFTACNAEGIWQEKMHDLAIKIHPPFYQTNTFRLIAFLLIAGLISFISTLYFRYQLREKQLQLEKQEREADRVRLELEKKLTLQTERTRIAGEMHDEIGSGLSTIRNASAKASRKNNFEDIKKIVDRVSQISINLINNMRGIIWAMDPDFDSLEDLSAYIRRYAVEYLDDNSLDANIKIPDDLPEISMNGQSRHNISLAVKEVLHNIVKHADASVVHFEIKIEKKLEIIIKDDGKGFDMATLKRRGHGLRNIAKRAQVLGGEATWNQNKPKGTIVKFVIPLDKNLS
ncbi:MAG: two-component regulator propeller domain-containing protein [Saprospiraceae bacterium]